MKTIEPHSSIIPQPFHGAPFWRKNRTNRRAAGLIAAVVLIASTPAPALEPLIVVGTNTYSAYRTDLTPGTRVYVDADPASATPVRATQRSLGYREVEYKSAVPGTLYFNAVNPTTNAGTVTYDYSAQANKTNLVGFWVSKDVPMMVGPDGNAYVADGHHTVAGYLAPLSPVRQFIPGKNRVILGHILANFYDPVAGPQPVTDAWWAARAAENDALLYGPEGDQLALPGEPNYSALQPILPSVLAMPSTPSTLTTGGAVAMSRSIYRGLAWGLADGVVLSATNSAANKIVGFKKSAPGSTVDIFFVEFFWADYLRHRVVWDDTLTGSPFGSINGDASVTAAPLSFFTATANGIALAKSQAYQDEYGRNLVDYTNSAVFAPNVVGWAQGSLSNGLALPNETYSLYLRDDSTIAGPIQPSPLSTNILHIDTVSGLTVTQALQNIRTAIVNAGGTLRISWKDITVSNTILTLPAGAGIVNISGTNFVAANTILGGGTLAVDGTLGGNLQVTNGILQGHGSINGAVSVLGTGTLAPGASPGTLAVNGPLILGGTVILDANKSGAIFTSDQVGGITALIYGGTLTLLASGDSLVAGDGFKLFDATSRSGAFASFNLPALSGGLAWDTTPLLADGTIRVVAGDILPTLAAQPGNQTVNVGSTATLPGGAVGTLPLTGQWRFNGSDLAGQTNPNLTLRNVQKTNEGSYVFVARNSAGSVTSAPAILIVNQTPAAQAQTLTALWNTALNITLAGTDPDSDALAFTVTKAPAHGTLTGTAPSLSYQPAANYVGADTFIYRVSDGRLSATATITINVKPVALAMATAGTNLVVSWPQTASIDTLQQAAALPSPTNAWSAVDGPPVPLSGRWQVTIPAPRTNLFFRVKSP